MQQEHDIPLIGQAPAQPAFPQLNVGFTPDGKTAVFTFVFGNGFQMQQGIAEQAMNEICAAWVKRQIEASADATIANKVKRNLKRND